METNVMQRRDARGTMDSGGGRFSLDALPNMLRLSWEPRIAIDRDDVARLKTALTSSGPPTLPLLVEVTRLEEVTWESRTAILAHGFSARIAVLGADAVDLVLTAFLVKTRTEARFFTQRGDAEEWLLQD